jgi:hypothetical protein
MLFWVFLHSFEPIEDAFSDAIFLVYGQATYLPFSLSVLSHQWEGIRPLWQADVKALRMNEEFTSALHRQRPEPEELRPGSVLGAALLAI